MSLAIWVGVVYVFALILIPWLSWTAENAFHEKLSHIHEVEDHILSTHDCKQYISALECFAQLKPRAQNKWPLHVTTDSNRFVLEASVEDPEFGVFVDNSLALIRQTEYCLWKEVTTTSGKKNRKRYSYSLGWQSIHINSSGFRHREGHENPPFDPFPPTTFWSVNARIAGIPIRPALFRNPHAGSPLPARPLRWMDTSSSSSAAAAAIAGDAPRWEDEAVGRGRWEAAAAAAAGFTYSPISGFFHARAPPTTAQKQEPCHLGDIRVSFLVRDPPAISVLAALRSPDDPPATDSGGATETASLEGSFSDPSETGQPYALDSFFTPQGYELGLVQAGRLAPFAMLTAALRDETWNCYYTRAALLLWGLLVCFLVSVMTNRAYRGWESLAPAAATVLSAASGYLGLVWMILWGIEFDSDHHEIIVPGLLLVSACLAVFAERSSRSRPLLRVD